MTLLCNSSSVRGEGVLNQLVIPVNFGAGVEVFKSLDIEIGFELVYHRKVILVISIMFFNIQ